MSAHLLVSVVIATRNRSASLAACLRALAGQTLTPAAYEVIVVDDGSTDDTRAIVERARAEHPTIAITLLRNEPQIGANPSRNRGVATARGRYVAFIDDDAVAEPAWLERLVAGFEDAETDGETDGVGAVGAVGAVTGLTLSTPPRNIFELTIKGTQRVHSPDGVRATRLVGTNMAVRRALLAERPLDEDRAAVVADTAVSGRGDEEGLFLTLAAAGHEQRVVHDAVVHHSHPHTASTLLRQAFRGGRSAAKLVHKYRLPPRLDLVPFVLAYGTLPLALLGWFFLLIPALFFTAALGGILYNDLFRKRKTILETLITFPILLVYYHARLAGYVMQIVRLWLGLDRLERVRLSGGASRGPGDRPAAAERGER